MDQPVIFRQLIDDDSKTYTYLLGDPWSREAVLIDPVREQLERDLEILAQLGLKLVHTLETHVHADHVTASALLRSRTGCRVVVPRAGGTEGADVEVDDGDAIRFGLVALEVRATPGHTNGCVSYVNSAQDHVFTGDALLIRGCGRTDFQEGDAHTLYRSVRDKLFSLPPDALVWPAHDYKGRTCSSIREEKLYNPRLGGGRTEEEFVAIMANLDLAWPRKMDVAVPANRRLGLLAEEPSPAEARADVEAWPVARTPTGAPSLPPLWIAEHREGVRLVDVREPDEWTGPDGMLDGAEKVRVADVPAAAAGWDREEPIALYCRSGGRSDRVARELEDLGFKRVASMSGGILAWRRVGLPLAGGRQG
jgi:glyoxylase-like metal-dependent hydrolase (beta-lactamase superfamily II)/rhodanese-related sulfurtransferase